MRVYALGADRVLRVMRLPADPAILERKRAFLAEIDGRLPFATPMIEAIAPDGGWTLERRIPGSSLLALLRRLDGDTRRTALARYTESADALAAVAFPGRPYGQILDPHPARAETWRGYLRLGLERFIRQNGTAIEQSRGDLASLRDKALALIDGVAETPTPVLVHGDYFPGNVMIGEDGRVSGLVDFSSWTVVGDPLYDAIGAAIFLEMTAEATAADIALVRQIVLARHGDSLLAPARFYRAYFAFAVADPRAEAGPYPRLWPWALSNLAALKDGTIGF